MNNSPTPTLHTKNLVCLIDLCVLCGLQNMVHFMLTLSQYASASWCSDHVQINNKNVFGDLRFSQ